MSVLSTPLLKKCLLFVPALGSFGPILIVMGLTGAPSSFHVIALVGALATGFAISLVGAALMRLLGEPAAVLSPTEN